MDTDLAEDGDTSSHNLRMRHRKNDSHLNVEGSSSEKKMKGIDCPISSELSCLSMNNTMLGNVKQNDTTSHHDRQSIEDQPNRSSEDLACRRHGFGNISLPYEEANTISKQGTSYQLLNSKHKNVMEQKNYATHVDDILEITAYSLSPDVKHQKIMRGKRKQHLSNFCESSGSGSGVSSENSETSTQLSKLIPSDGWSRISSQNNSYDYDMELDELQSPNLWLNNYHEQSFQFDDGIARISQMESDELLARRLQKQYNEEVAGAISTNEIDADIPGSLQETGSHLAASTTWSDQINNWEEPMFDLRGYYTQLASHNSSSRSSNHFPHQISNPRKSFQSSEVDLERKMVAEISNFTKMDSEKKREFLEALEDAFDRSNSVLDNLNEDDYEILLTLQKNAGASENQIDSLPQSTIKVGEVEEMCSICLEVPSFGHKIRHLPCLHKFHLQCIDVWLKRKACCPVCKLKIS